MKTQEEKRKAQNERKRQWRLDNPEKVKAASKKWYDARRSGYGVGRPKKGEVRPPSIGAIEQAKYRADNPELSAKRNRAAQAKWVAANPQKVKEKSRAYYLRKKGWNSLKAIEKVEKQLEKARKAADKGPPKYTR